MNKYLLDHLSDLEFDKRYDQLHDALDKALITVLDSWVEDGVIDSSGKDRMLESWSDGKYELFNGVLG